MKHLPGGDTGVNKWPVSVRRFSEMPKVSQTVHDEIFSHDVPVDSGDEEKSMGADLYALSETEQVVPFPREHDLKLTRQMMDKDSGLGADVGVFLHPGSGECLKAILQESCKRGLGIARNQDHKKFILDNLRNDIRINKRAFIQFPPKPPSLTDWENKSAGVKDTTAGVCPPPRPQTPAPSGGSPAPPLSGVHPPANGFGQSTLLR